MRHCIEATWLNDSDQFLFPNDGWQSDNVFKTDCIVYTLFHGRNRITARGGTNHWIPFTEAEVGAKDNFASHTMYDYLHTAHNATAPTVQPDLFGTTTEAQPTEAYCPMQHLSAEAEAVMQAGRELWRYYHAQDDAAPNASMYDIRMHFQGTKTTRSGKEQMNPDSSDATYTTLLANLRQAQRTLAQRIETKVYAYGFLKESSDECESI